MSPIPKKKTCGEHDSEIMCLILLDEISQLSQDVTMLHKKKKKIKFKQMSPIRDRKSVV